MNIALRIARCETFLRFPNLESSHGCYEILSEQAGVEDRQVPEPFRGSLSAPILFLASNPSIDKDDESPRASVGDEALVELFANFPSSYPKIKSKSGEHVVRFWAFVRARAGEVMQVPPKEVGPGADFAITEVVHCKSRGEIGVRNALVGCRIFLRQVLHESDAKLVIALGQHARKELGLLLDKEIEVGEVVKSGPRVFAALPHSNAREIRTFRARYTSEDLMRMRSALVKS